MKRIVVLTLYLLFVLLVSAQTRKHELRLSIGSVNDDYHHWNYIGNWGYNSATTSDYNSWGLYLGGKKTMGVISASYFYHPSWINGRFTIGGSFSFSHFSQDVKMCLTDRKAGDIKEYNVAFTPSIRYSWVSKSIFQIYSGFGVSLYGNSYKCGMDELHEVLDYKKNKFEASFQLTPIGIAVGKDIFGFGELNLGGRSGVFVGGIGYRF